MGSSSGAAAPMAGGRGCQEQEQQQEGIKGAWDGAAANGGEAERGEGRGARESWLQRKRKEGATAAAPLRRTKHRRQRQTADAVCMTYCRVFGFEHQLVRPMIWSWTRAVQRCELALRLRSLPPPRSTMSRCCCDQACPRGGL